VLASVGGKVGLQKGPCLCLLAARQLHEGRRGGVRAVDEG
jgi:hypothetical protein